MLQFIRLILTLKNYIRRIITSARFILTALLARLASVLPYLSVKLMQAKSVKENKVRTGRKVPKKIKER